MALETEFWALVDTANELDAEAARINDDDSAEPVDSNRYVESTYVAICDLVAQNPKSHEPVSYTHLTLPTICSV